MKKTPEQNISGRKLPLVEDFFSIQGEGYHCGKAAYFIRLGGCDVGCSWCDSPYTWDHLKYPLINSDEIVERVIKSGSDSVVITGGEPLMWNLEYLCTQFEKNNISAYLETSGAYPMTGSWYWICLSPKRDMIPNQEICRVAHELKVIIQDPLDFRWAERFRKMVNDNCMLFLQPEWSSFDRIIPEIVDYVKQNNEWRISLQIHKYMHIP